MKSLVLDVVIAYPESILLHVTELVYVQLFVITGVVLEEETPVTPVVLKLQLGMFVTCGQLDKLMLVVAV